jgi:hypothetical protein
MFLNSRSMDNLSLRALSHSNSTRFKKRSSIPLSEPEVNTKGFRIEAPRGLNFLNFAKENVF